MKKKKNIIIKIIGGSTIIMTVVAMTILIAVLMIFDFFGSNLTKEKVENNLEYGDAYLEAVNENIRYGYVPLQRILYFRLEDETLTFKTLYDINLDRQDKKTDEIESVCTDERLKNLVACTSDNIEQNKEYLTVTTRRFNFPLDTDSYQVTSFFNQQREVYGQTDTHQGWDLATSAKTPVYSVCDGTVSRVTFTQKENIPFSESGNKTGKKSEIKLIIGQRLQKLEQQVIQQVIIYTTKLMMKIIKLLMVCNLLILLYPMIPSHNLIKLFGSGST